MVNSYDQVGRKEDVSDVITNISPTTTPYQTMIGRESIHNIVFSWQEDSLIAAVANNAVVEGAAAPNASFNPTVLRTSTTQILTKTATVSGTADVISLYGRDKELAYQLTLRSKEIKRDLEMSLVGSNSASATGNDTTARTLAPYMQQVNLSSSGNVLVVTGTTGTTAFGGTAGTPFPLTEAMILAVSQQMYTNGVDPTTLMVKPSDALLVSAMQANGRTRFVDNGQKNIVNVVDKYVSPYGELNVVMNRFQLTSTALIFDPSYWKLCPLRNWFRQTLGKVGDSTQVGSSASSGTSTRTTSLLARSRTSANDGAEGPLLGLLSILQGASMADRFTPSISLTWSSTPRRRAPRPHRRSPHASPRCAWLARSPATSHSASAPLWPPSPVA